MAVCTLLPHGYQECEYQNACDFLLVCYALYHSAIVVDSGFGTSWQGRQSSLKECQFSRRSFVFSGSFSLSQSSLPTKLDLCLSAILWESIRTAIARLLQVFLDLIPLP